jgi:mersacidin/lichenicidin family type 2 lantibiotic
MSIKDIIRAWKDSSYRESLSEEQRTLLPDNPIGEVLSQDDLLAVSGGFITECWTVDDEPCSCYVSESWC